MATKKKPAPRAPRMSTQDKINAAVQAALAGVAAAQPPIQPMQPAPPAQPANSTVDKIRVTGLWPSRSGKDGMSGKIQRADEVMAYLQRHPNARAVIFPNGFRKGPDDAQDILYFYPAEKSAGYRARSGGVQYSRAAGGQGYPPRGDGENNKPIGTEQGNQGQNERF